MTDENGITSSSGWSSGQVATGEARSGSGAAATTSRRRSSMATTMASGHDGEPDLAGRLRGVARLLEAHGRRRGGLGLREEAGVLVAIEVVVRAPGHEPTVG